MKRWSFHIACILIAGVIALNQGGAVPKTESASSLPPIHCVEEQCVATVSNSTEYIVDVRVEGDVRTYSLFSGAALRINFAEKGPDGSLSRKVWVRYNASTWREHTIWCGHAYSLVKARDGGYLVLTPLD